MRPDKRDWMGFGFWVLVGLVCALSVIVLGALALVPLLVIAGASCRPRAGLVEPPIHLGWDLHRVRVAPPVCRAAQSPGPGTICWRTAAAAGCDEYLNPWPWLLGALALIVPSSSMVFVKIRRVHAQGDNHYKQVEAAD